jgi:hypothetical protein
MLATHSEGVNGGLEWLAEALAGRSDAFNSNG